MKKLLGILAAIGVVSSASGSVISCGNKNDSASNEVKTPSINAINDQFLSVNEKIENLEVNITNPVKDTKLTATSNNDNVTVESSPEKDDNSTGKFTLVINGKKEGTSLITLKYGDVSSTFNVTVDKKPEELTFNDEQDESKLTTYLKSTVISDNEISEINTYHDININENNTFGMDYKKSFYDVDDVKLDFEGSHYRDKNKQVEENDDEASIYIYGLKNIFKELKDLKGEKTEKDGKFTINSYIGFINASKDSKDFSVLIYNVTLEGDTATEQTDAKATKGSEKLAYKGTFELK
ncbi:lipoprotein [Spiroplasma turonicum]|uniref:Lipoprotein n=1 Tax=Spiroplasma turonicum TaxID=216946 RepID=A0A0K1P6Y2_9MOLU|nr:lipoprotein [Spiroplasma turonicum]AKU80030.1 hypothetical protein STURON_00784 [Spiroplasma turonicum]ALX71032.1 hypothetical protein STURO_v1c07810 [Spiroplasma turonicum]